MKTAPTPKERDAMEFAGAFYQHNGRGPTSREIAQALEIEPATAHTRMTCLRLRGKANFGPTHPAGDRCSAVTWIVGGKAK
jgi:hypothetical protein